jgi:hypothetical protein
VSAIIAAYRRNENAAAEAWRLLKSFYPERVPPRVPGMDTIIRLGVRIDNGRSVEQAAAREYVYRWGLVLRPDPDCTGDIFGAPHLLGF